MTTEKNKKSATKKLEKMFGPLTIASLLLSTRKTDEITQAAMAKKLGISQQRLCDFEKGRRLPSAKFAVKFAKKLGLHPETLVEILLQDQLRRENVNFKVSVAS